MLTNTPLVSVITPAFNSEKFIRETIESVLNQTWQNWEMLIVDDYSTDNTYNIIKKHAEKDSRIHIFRLNANSGCRAVPRNHAIKRSKGEYIAFLDSDDVWLQNKLEKQIDLMESNKEIAMSYVLFSFLLEDGSIKGEYPKPKNRFEGYIFKSLYFKPIIANSSVMVRREVFKELGLLNEDAKLAFSEDYDMWLKIARTKRVHYVNGVPLLLYRVGHCGIFKRSGGKELKRMMFIAKRHAPYAGKRLYILKVISFFGYLLKYILINKSGRKL